MWQNIFGVMNDGISERTTHSRRGLVRGINYYLNTNRGIPVEISSIYHDGKNKVKKVDLRRVPKELREKIREGNAKIINENTFIEHNIQLKILGGQFHRFKINGMRLKEHHIEILRQIIDSGARDIHEFHEFIATKV